MSEGLHHEVVYSKLQWRWSWHGLRPLHLMGALAPGTFFFGFGSFLQNFWPLLPAWWGFPITGASLVFIGTMQYHRDRLYFVRMLDAVRLPRTLSPFLAPRHPNPPFPVARERLEQLCPRS